LRSTFVGRVGDRLVPERRQALLHLRNCNGLGDLAVEECDDVFWRSRWEENNIPVVAFDAWIAGFVGIRRLGAAYRDNGAISAILIYKYG